MSLGVKKGDYVKIIAGNDKGKFGQIVAVDREAGRVTVEGKDLSVVKKAVRVSGRNCEYRQTDRPKIRANPIPESRHLFILCISPAP